MWPDLVTIAAGDFWMGNDGPDAIAGDGEGPARRVHLSAFRIAPAVVTNREFAAFVRATHYVTEAEQEGVSFVFFLQVPEAVRSRARRVARGLPWWMPVENASWQRPEGSGSHIFERLDHPVVHVSWNDAAAYCAWAGVSLPTEAQWEKAARGGLEGKRFAWGDHLVAADGSYGCNVWRGTFPEAPEASWSPAPVAARSGAANGYGLFNTCGNVWEWCADAYNPDYHTMTASIDPRAEATTGSRALRGGSFLCHESYCYRYRVSARHANTPSSAASNVGFRVCVSSP
jgi:formylglycine-generating enzyme required for sulfatase activity